MSSATDQSATDNVVPTTFAQWRHCIEVECGLVITPRFLADRLAALQNPKDPHTQRFLRVWGQSHHARVLEWFRQAQAELEAPRGGSE